MSSLDKCNACIFMNKYGERKETYNDPNGNNGPVGENIHELSHGQVERRATTRKLFLQFHLEA
eukprot:9962514-Prorocentrum_lima.AAC.1